MEWTLSPESNGDYDDFVVRYCADRWLCREVHTTELSIYATNLKPATRYEVEVRARLRNGSGKARLGLPYKANVTTWSAGKQIWSVD